MLKINKNLSRVVVAIVLVSLLTMYGTMSPANAASLTNSSDTLSDSTPNVAANHTVEFTTGTALAATDYMEVSLPTQFGDIWEAGCPGGTTIATTTDTVKCTSDAGTIAGTYQISMSGVINPSATTTYTVNIATKHAGGAEIESAQVAVAIVDGVSVTATVPATMTFSVKGLNPNEDVNGVTTNGTSTANSISFGSLDYTATSTIGQQLEVSTNAVGGYSVTVQQNKNLTSDNGSDIDSFNNGYAASTSAENWVEPTGTLNDERTYGHFGFTSEDANLAGDVDVFGAGKFMGFGNFTVSDPVNPIEVMYNDGPSNGTTPDIGMTQVAYSVKITALQEAGDYTNTLTYICTPTY